MDRFYLTQNEAGRWNVVDRLTGGPVEIAGHIMYDMDQDDAEDMADLLTLQDQQVLARLNEITKKRESP